MNTHKVALRISRVGLAKVVVGQRRTFFLMIIQFLGLDVGHKDV